MSDDKHQRIYAEKSREKIVCPKCNQVTNEKIRLEKHPLYLYLCEDCIKGVTDKYFNDLIF